MKNRVPLLSQKPFQQSAQIVLEQPQEQTFDLKIIPAEKQPLQTQNLSNKAFVAAIKKSWTNGVFTFINQPIDQFPIELARIGEINLEGESWWMKCPLKKIDLSNNQIQNILLLDNLIDLQSLRMDSNQITQIPNTFFDRLNQLKSLSLIKNCITQFPIQCLNCPNLVELVLSENQIQEFASSETIDQNFQNLEILDLRSNRLINFPFLHTAHKLKRLNCGQNMITKLTSSQLFSCDQLEDLLVFKNQITQLDPQIFKNLKSIKIIDFRENRLRIFNQELFGESHNQLDQILLSFNLIDKYSVYHNINQLSVLLINYNKIQYLHPDIINLKQLKTLDLSNNNLVDLPNEIGFLSLLVRIQLEGNPLRCIRQNLRTAGADILKKYLQSRIPEDQFNKYQAIPDNQNKKPLFQRELSPQSQQQYQQQQQQLQLQQQQQQDQQYQQQLQMQQQQKQRLQQQQQKQSQSKQQLQYQQQQVQQQSNLNSKQQIRQQSPQENLQIQQQQPILSQQEINFMITKLNGDIQILENQIRDDFTLNNFQKQDKKRNLQQKQLERNQLQRQIQ